MDELQRGDSEGIDAAENCDEEDQASKSLKGEVQSADSLKGEVQSADSLKEGVQSADSLKGEVQSADSLKEGVQSGESPNRVQFSPKGEVASSRLHKANVCAIPTNDQNEPSEEHIGNKSTVAVEVAPPAANTRTTRLWWRYILPIGLCLEYIFLLISLYYCTAEVKVLLPKVCPWEAGSIVKNIVKILYHWSNINIVKSW